MRLQQAAICPTAEQPEQNPAWELEEALRTQKSHHRPAGRAENTGTPGSRGRGRLQQNPIRDSVEHGGNQDPPPRWHVSQCSCLLSPVWRARSSGWSVGALAGKLRGTTALGAG